MKNRQVRLLGRSAPQIAAMCAVLQEECALQPAYQRPAMQTPLEWTNGVPGTMDTNQFAVTQDGWWIALGDEPIDTLVSAILQDNPTLSVASERPRAAPSAAT